MSDTKRDGFESLFGESESNESFSGSRFFLGESDMVSFGGESGVSVDEHTFLENEIYHYPDRVSNQDADTDIDPMHHAGLYYWNLDYAEDEYINSGETNAT